MEKEIYEIRETFETKFGIIEIIDKKIKNKHTLYKIKFLNTGNEKWTQKQYIDKDKVEDEIALEREFISKIYKNNNGEEFKVFPEFIRKYSNDNHNRLGTKYYKIQFLKSGNIDYRPKKAILSGSISDNKAFLDEILNKTYKNFQNENFKIIEYIDTNKCKIRFEKTKWETYAKFCHIKNGCVQDKMLPHPIFKIFMGEGIYNSGINLEYKNIIGIISKIHYRCYNKNDVNYKNYGAKGVIVDDYFHNIQNFCKWYYEQKEKYYNDYEGQLDVDKDILSNIKHLENKIYSPETCLLIPKNINIALAGESVKCGVYHKKNSKSFKIDYGLIKYFKTFKEAKYEYAKNKKKLWIEEINKYNISKEIKEILLQYDFSWSWIWENMTEEEILNIYYK